MSLSRRVHYRRFHCITNWLREQEFRRTVQITRILQNHSNWPIPLHVFTSPPNHRSLPSFFTISVYQIHLKVILCHLSVYCVLYPKEDNKWTGLDLNWPCVSFLCCACQSHDQSINKTTSSPKILFFLTIQYTNLPSLTHCLSVLLHFKGSRPKHWLDSWQWSPNT